jgi:uncharacterized Zn finger protein
VCDESRTHGSEGGKASRDAYLSRRLASGAYAITVTRFTEDEISAQVANGDGKSYPVTLTAMRSFCGCNDSLFRGRTCKHAVSLALCVIRTPETEMKTEVPAPNLTLAKMRQHLDTGAF